MSTELKKEMFAIASVHEENSQAYGNDSPPAEAFKDTEKADRNGTKMQIAVGAVINARTGGADYSNGATQWDGKEQGQYNTDAAHTKMNSGVRIELHMNTMGWNISDAHYSKWKSAIDSSFKAPQVKAATTGINRGKIRLNSTAVYNHDFLESNKMRTVFILTVILLTNCSKSIDSKPIQSIKIKKNSTIDILEDGKKFFTYNEQDLPIEAILYNTETGKIESTSKYNYQDGKFNYISQNNIKDEDYTESVLTYLYQNKRLSSRGIKFEHPELIFSEIGDLSNVLTVGKYYNDFKKDSVINGNEKTIIYKNFNKKIRFYPSNITQFIPEDEIIKDYNLVIKDSLPIKETFLLENNQSLKREYFYDKSGIKKITYISSDQTNKLQREFIYKN